MTTNSMYENLMTLPLFKGISYARLSEIVGNTRLAFLKYLPGEPMLTAGDQCRKLNPFGSESFAVKSIFSLSGSSGFFRLFSG